MDGLDKILEALAGAKTPLAVGGVIAAVVISVVWQIAKRSTLDVRTVNMIVIGGYGLAALVLILGFVGFVLPSSNDADTRGDTAAQKPKNVTVLGTVFGDSDNTVGVAQASITIVPVFDFKLRKIAADQDGSFETEFDGIKGATPARIWAAAPGFKTSPPQTIVLDPDAPHAEQRQITLVSATVEGGAAARVPQVSLVTVPTDSGRNPASVPSATSWDEIHTAAQGNELKLANAASDAFQQGDYKVSARFLSEAKSTSTSGVWKSSYPKLAASYYLTGDAARGKQTLQDMVADIKHDIAQGGYLGTSATLAFVLQDLSDARAKVPDPAKADFDSTIGMVTRLRDGLLRSPVAAQNANRLRFRLNTSLLTRPR